MTTTIQTRTERNGQSEIGTVVHNGREFSALGAMTNGRHVAGYTKRTRAGIILQTWNGATIVGSRCEIARKYRVDAMGDTFALVFRLTKGRAIVGYALGDNGMLFRGELTDGTDFNGKAESIAENCIEMDAEDAERFQEELDAEDESEDE